MLTVADGELTLKGTQDAYGLKLRVSIPVDGLTDENGNPIERTVQADLTRADVEQVHEYCEAWLNGERR